MSFIIKGIDLPKDEVITFHYLNEQGEMVIKIIDKSDAIQIPKEHGKIGDLDALAEEIKEKDIMGGLNYERYIKDAPTILEEE